MRYMVNFPQFFQPVNEFYLCFAHLNRFAVSCCISHPTIGIVFSGMKKIIQTAKLLQTAMMAVLFVLTGCASIVSKSNWPVNFKSNPPGAEVVITDSMGNEVDRGTTPVIFTLKSSDGFFSGATYYAEFKFNDYQVCKRGIRADVNGWYFGNIFFGGFVGLLVDPLTGAMWKLQPLCTVNLNKIETTSMKQ